MEHKLKSVALHITNKCTHRCPMCYATPEGQYKCEADFDTLLLIAKELKKAGVEEINLVGGDPATYSQIEQLLKELHTLGFKLPVLSNTHEYRHTVLKRIVPYVTSLETTFHGKDLIRHNNFCNNSS